MSKTLVWVVLVLVILLYLQHYTYTRKNIQIIQVYLDKVDANQLYEKYPIVIYDRMVEPEKLLQTLFKYLYTSQRFLVLSGGEHVYLTPFKYCVLYSSTSDVNVKLMVPTYHTQFHFKAERGVWRSDEILSQSQVQYVTMKLKKQQVLILPTGWMFQTDVPLRAICLHDPISRLVDFFYTRARTHR